MRKRHTTNGHFWGVIAHWTIKVKFQSAENRMFRKVSWLFFVLVVAGFSSIWACGGPECNNDSECKDGKVCVHHVCQIYVFKDAGSQKEITTTEQKKEQPTQKEEIPEKLIKEHKIQPEPKPEKPQVQGMRGFENSCDPRRGGYKADQCKAGLACAELGQTTPSSGAPQPYGICLKACDPQKKNQCPKGTRCRETLNTKTRQGTGIYVCAKEVGSGEFCLNDSACKEGLECILYGRSGMTWICQKNCTKDGQCPSGSICKPVTEGSSKKVCKKLMKIDQPCGVYSECEKDGICISGNRYGAFPSRCLKRCDKNPNACDATEICRQLSYKGKPIGAACFKKAHNGEECRRGRSCSDKNAICLDISMTYSGCFAQCRSSLDCAKDETCDKPASSVPAICRKLINPGEVALNLAKCGAGGRAIAFAKDQPGICLPNCSAGSSPAPALCGKLTPSSLYALAKVGSRLMTIGGLGFLGYSSDHGMTWTRGQLPISKELTGLAVSGDGKLAIAVGANGLILRSEAPFDQWNTINVQGMKDKIFLDAVLTNDGKIGIIVGNNGILLRSTDSGKTWKSLPLKLKADLKGIAFGQTTTGAGATSLMIAVGTQGTILRSDDQGATWKSITSPIKNASFYAVSIVKSAVSSGIGALIAGTGGAILTSSDDGKTWKEEKSPTKVNFYGAHISDANHALAVGDKGTIAYWDGKNWQQATNNEKRNLYAAHIDGQNAVAVGVLGSVIYSTDGGKTWSPTRTTLLKCIGVSSNGRAAGGACLFLCDPAKKGKDCPIQMNQCGTLQLRSGRLNICMAGSGLSGTKGRGESCSLYSGAPPSQRCKKNHSCVRYFGGTVCLQRCTKDGKLPCDGGTSCVASPSLRGYFCGQTVGLGEECDFRKGKFCKVGTLCKHNVFTNKATCQAVTLAKENEFCVSKKGKTCVEGYMCIGLSLSPYRYFCARQCNPRSSNSGCAAGWDCLATSSGEGVCIERCSSPQTSQCSIKGLRCQRVTSKGYHCL